MYNTLVAMNSTNASVVEWSITTDCKSVGLGLRWFESNLAHTKNKWLRPFFCAPDQLDLFINLISSHM